MPPIPVHAAVVRRSKVVANDLSDSETVMLDIDRGVYFGVRGVGRDIWDRLAHPTTLEALVAALTAEYRVDETRCWDDVEGFLCELLEQGLIEVQVAPAFG